MSSVSGRQDDLAAPAPAAPLSPATPSPASAAAQSPAPEEAATRIASDDAELFRRAQGGDRGAFGQIVQLHQDRVYNAVLRMVGDLDDARDLTQETFTRALVKIDTFRGEAQPYTWLFRIALNLAIGQLRKARRHRTVSLDAGSSGGGNGQSNKARPAADDQGAALKDRLSRDGAPGPDQQVEHAERNRAVLAALGRLDAEYRAVLVMRDVEGFDYQQMADLLGLPLGTLKSRLFRARIALRDELRPYMEKG
jgi:RNA polymerase sigma-70 factor (ECF subfamily)